MKELREGVSTGSCMTGGAEASVIWQTTGKCPSVVKVETPIGKTLYLDIIPKEFGVCGVVKDAGVLENAARKKAEQKQTAPVSGGFQIVSESGETDAQVEALLQARYDAKKAKDFTEADRIRDDLKAMGVEITDIPGGVRWKR